MTTSRRAIIGAAAALAGGSIVNLTAISATGAAQPDDPIFTAIDAYQRAEAFHGECLVKADAIEQQYWNLEKEYKAHLRAHAERAPDISDDDFDKLIRVAAKEKASADADMDECWRLRHLGGDAERAAEDALLATVPTTTAGMLAMLSHMMPDGKPLSPLRATFSGDNEQVAAFIETLATFLRRQS